MSDMSQARFAEYATSGAFNISLTRRQVSALAMFSDRDEWSAIGYDSLERKGLITVLPRAGHHPPAARITAAGVSVAHLCAMAGLTNTTPPEHSTEIDALHVEIAELRRLNAELAEDCHSMHARAQALGIELRELQAEKAGGRFPRPMVMLKDRQPDKAVEDMIFMGIIKADAARPEAPHDR